MQVLQDALKKLLDCVPSLVVIITSRIAPQFLKLASKIQLVPMKGLTTQDACELLCSVSPEISQASAQLLAVECGKIPYALSLIGKSMFLNGISAEVSDCTSP